MTDRALRRHPARRHAGRGHVADRRGEGARRRTRLDELGVDLIEAGFPASNPKELELFGAPGAGAASTHAADRRVRHDAPPRRRRRRTTRRCRSSPTASRRSCTIVGKTWDLHLREGASRVDRDENLAMIARLGRLPGRRGQARHLRRRALLRRLAREPGLRARVPARGRRRPAPSASCCATPTASSLPARDRRRASRPCVAALGDEVALGIHCHNDLRRARVANTLAAVAAGATQVQGTINGIGERTRQRQPGVDHRQPAAASSGYEVLDPEQLRRPDRGRALRRRAAQPATPDPAQPFVGRSAFAHKGGLHVAGVRADASTFEHIDPALVGNARELLVSELAGRARPSPRRPRPPAWRSTTRRRARDRARQGRSSTRGYQFEAADGSFELLLRKEAGEYEPLFRLESWRVDRRAARRRQGRDRGHHQDLGRRRALRAHRRGQRPGQRARRGAARRDRARSTRTSATIELVNYKVRILDEPHGTDATTRVLIDVSDGDDDVGLDRRGRERHRRLVAGARRLAGVRRAGRRGVGPRRAEPA